MFASILSGVTLINPDKENFLNLSNSVGNVFPKRFGKIFFKSLYVAVKLSKSLLKIKPRFVLIALVKDKSPITFNPLFEYTFKSFVVKLFSFPLIFPVKLISSFPFSSL